MKINSNLKKSVLAAFAVAGLSSMTAYAYGPLYIHDYAAGTPYRWDVSSPVQVYTDGGNFASGTVSLWVQTPDTCNAEGGWDCGHYEEIYVEFTNEQGVATVVDALASWSAVPSSTFQAEVAGNFAGLGIGGDDGDITGAPEEFSTDANGEIIHEILGTVNGGGIHVVFDEDGQVMENVLGVPYGVLGVASPEWADEETGIITEGWAFIGGAGTHYNDTDLAQMAGVVTHELGHSFNLAHTQTNGHVVMLSDQAVTTAGPVDCSAHWYVGGEYQLPFPQHMVPTAQNMAVMYPYIEVNPNEWANSTGEYQATVSTAEDFAAISSIYPAASFASDTGTLTGSVTFPFSANGIIGVNIVARNIDNPFEDAISVMSGDWNDGVPGAAEGVGEFTLKGLTPGARYVVHAENIFAGGFPTPQVLLPGPSEYFNGPRENDDANNDDACDYEEIVVAAGATQTGINIQINGVKKAPRLVINPAPDAANITENGQTMAGNIVDWYGDAASWIYDASRDEYTVVPMGGIRMSDNGSIVAGRVVHENQYLPARMVPGKKIEIIQTPGNNGCDEGDGYLVYYFNNAISPDGSTMGGYLYNCDNVEGLRNFGAAAATYNDQDGWTVLNDHFDNLNSRVDGIANDGTAVGWAEQTTGWWEGVIWKDGVEISMKNAAPENMMEIGQATAVSSDGSMVVGTDALDEFYNARGYTYNTRTSEFKILDIYEECPWWDWFCFGEKPFNPYDIADDGTIVGAMDNGTATMVNDVLGTVKLADFLKAQGVINASDLGVASNARKITSNGKHIAGWAAVDGAYVSFSLTLDQLWVCRNGKSQQVGYPGAVASHLKKGATLGMCEADLPLQYKANF